MQKIRLLALAAAWLIGLQAVVCGQRLDLKPGSTEVWEPVAQAASRAAVAAQAATAPVLDGKLDDPAWRQATGLGAFDHVGGIDADASQWVVLQALVHDRVLYLSGRLANPGTPLRAMVTENGGRVWTDDCLELFFHDSAGAATSQITVNARGAWWAGAKGGTGPWTPAVRVAATQDQQGWTVELAIPLADLPMARGGEAAVPFQARYLVRNQAAYVAWAPGQEPAEMGLLCFRDEQLPDRKVRVTALLMPMELAAGGGEVGLRLHNPSKQARVAVLRLLPGDDSKNVVTERVSVEPGQTREVTVRVTPPTEPRTFVLMAQDAAEGRWSFREDRRIVARPDFRLTLLRERFWYGERRIEGELDLGVPADELPQTTLTLSLLSRTQQLEQTPTVAMTATRYTLGIDLRDLPVGAYKLVAERRGPGGVKTDVHDLAIEQAMPLPARHRVALQIDWPQNVGDAAPVYCGLSLPGGTLLDVGCIRLVDDRGQEVTVQVDPLATWSPAGSLRWVALRFDAQRGRQYAVELGSEVKRSPAGQAIGVRETQAAIVVETGAARWELPRVGPLLGKAWIGQSQVLAGDRAVLVLRDQAGRIADETRNSNDEQPVVELAGPRHVVIRREGLYRTADGQRLGKYVARIAFDAGSSVARLQHSFIVTEDSDKVQYADVSVHVAPAFAGPWRASTPHGQQRYEANIDPTGGGVYLAQLVYPHFQKTDSRYEIGQRRDGRWASVEQGSVAGNWIAAQRSDGATGVALAIRDFAKTFPKELQVGDGAVTAHLWSSRGGRLLDYRPATLVEHWGLEWSGTYPGGLEKLKATKANAAGTARTHDVTIHLLGPDANLAQAQQVAHRLDAPVLAIQDPHWLRATEALGPLHPYDPQRFPRIEAFTRNVFKQLFVDQAENCGDFGYLDHGNGPHTMTRTPTATPGKGHTPRMGYRYTNTEYHGRTAMWLAYARSGDRLYHDYAAPFTRHLYDYRFSYWSGPKRKIGGFLGGGVSEDVPLYWAGWTGHDDLGMYAGHQGIDLANFQMQYFLTGDRRALDGPALFARRLVEDFDPMQLPNVGATSSACMALALPAQAYFQTWDERIGRKLHVARQRALDLRTTTGLAQQDYYGAKYKWLVRHWATLEDYKVTGAARSRDALLTGLPLLLHHVPEPGLGYQDHSGAYANYAARWSDDPRWASWLLARIAATVSAFSDEQGNLIAEPYAGTHNFNFPQVVAYGLDLIARDAHRMQPYPQLEVFNFSDVAPIWLRKQANQDLTLHVRHRPQWDLRLAHYVKKLEEWRGSYAGPLHVKGQREAFSRTAAGLAEGNLALRLPPDMVPGEYELTGVSGVMASNADALVVLARDGVYLPGQSLEPQPWHFAMPAHVRGRISLSRDTELSLGQRKQMLTAGQWHELANDSEEPMVATLSIRGLTYVRFAGDIPAVLTAHDPSRLFIPQGTAVAPIALPDPVDAGAAFVAGRSSRPNDQAVVICGTDLTIPVGRRLGVRQWEHLDWRRGTIEFWYQPRWTSDLQTAPITKTILGGAALPFSIEYNHRMPAVLDRRSVFFGMGALNLHSQGGPGSWSSMRLINPTQVYQGRWVHIAVCWNTEPEGRGWLAELYRDGLGSGFEGGGRNAAGPFHIHQGELGFKQFTPRDRGEEANNPVIWLMSALDGAVDDLRISNVVRYPGPFDVRSANPGVEDEHTLLLLRFDGNLDAVAARSEPPVSARRGR